MTLETLNALSGAVLSLLFSFSSIRNWFDALSGDAKRLTILGLLAALSLCSYLLACSSLGPAFELPVTCDEGGAVALLRAFLAAAVSNQAAYALTPRNKAEGEAAG